MVRRCVAAACYSTVRGRCEALSVSEDLEQRRKWEEQVRQTRDRWEAPSHSFVLCSRYFEVGCCEAELGVCEH